MLDIEDKLNFQNAVYPIQRTEMLTYTIAQGSQSHNKESLFRGAMPKLIFVTFIRNDAYNGTYARNPFHFQNFGVNQLGLYREGEPIAFRPFSPNYASNFYMREYQSIAQALNIYNKSESVDISMNEFANGYAIYGFNLTPDLSVTGHAQSSRAGNLRLEVQFAAATTETLNEIGRASCRERVLRLV